MRLYLSVVPLLAGMSSIAVAQDSFTVSCEGLSKAQCNELEVKIVEARREILLEQLAQLDSQIAAMRGGTSPTVTESSRTPHASASGRLGVTPAPQFAASSASSSFVLQPSLFPSSSPQAPDPDVGEKTSEDKGKEHKQDEKKDKPKYKNPLEGPAFGLGIALTYDLGDNDRVKDAQLVNGIVRVNDLENVTARFLLESHYFFEPSGGFLGLDNSQWGYGPFVAVEAGSDPIIKSLGGGIMLGFRRPSANPDEPSNESFNIGLGFIYDLDNQILGEGIVANQPLPDGETEIRFQEKEQFGALVMTSFSF